MKAEAAAAAVIRRGVPVEADHVLNFTARHVREVFHVLMVLPVPARPVLPVLHITPIVQPAETRRLHVIRLIVQLLMVIGPHGVPVAVAASPGHVPLPVVLGHKIVPLPAEHKPNHAVHRMVIGIKIGRILQLQLTVVWILS